MLKQAALCVTSRAATFNLDGITEVLNGLSKTGHVSPKVMDALGAQLQTLISSANASVLLQIIKALARVD
eukprot:gene2773-13564_t